MVFFSWHKNNPNYARDYRQINKLKLEEKQMEYLKKYPWIAVYRNTRSKCFYNKKHNYYKRKLENTLTSEQVKQLWFRDRAYLLSRPSIDRIDSSKGYLFENCRFIELKENQNRRKYYAN